MRADRQRNAALKNRGSFGVLPFRWTGERSLTVLSAAKLCQVGKRSVILDLSGFGQNGDRIE